MSENNWTIEPHGDGLVLYEGRTNEMHGLNLVYLSEPAHQWPRVKPLIEAAPDLLAALKRIVHDWDGEPEDMQEAVEAIRKAETRNPTPPLLSQEEAFQRAVKAGLFAGLVSKPEDAA